MSREKELKKIEEFIESNKALLSTSRSMRDIYEISMNRNPGKTAMVYFDDEGKKKKISYAAFKNMVFTTASKLSGALSGVPGGTVIGLKLKNTRFWPIFFWAILMCGHTPLLINAMLPTDNSNNLLSQAKAQAIIANDEAVFCVPNFRVNDIMNLAADYSFVPDWADHVIFCSSGTTGAAKMAVYSGKNLCAQVIASTGMGNITPDLMYPGKINIFCMIPFHHIFGFVAVFLWFTFYGKTLVFPSSLATKDLLYAVKKGKVTHLFSVPLFWDSIAQSLSRKVAMMGPKRVELLEKMVAYNTHKIDKSEAGAGASGIVKSAFQKQLLGKHIRYCISGGGYLSPKTASLINGIGYPLYNGYGMTEIGVSSVEMSPNVEQRLKGSIGKPLYGIEYKIEPLEGSDDDSIGELLVRSDIVHTREYLGGALTRMNYEDGFFRTGDIASRDEQGYYYIKSRIKDTIILANGENVYPDEIEDYFKDVKHINHCVVLGAKPKGESEEMICLVVEVENSMKAEDIAQLKQDIKSINESLPSEKRVRKIFLDRHPLPMSNNMKIKRVTVKKGLEEGSDDYLDFEGKRKKVSFEGYDAERVAAMQTAVAKIFSNVLLLPEFKIDYNADWGADLSGDSMSYIEMIQAIETDIGVKIPDSLFGSLMTVNDFAKQILDMQDGKAKDGDK